MKYLHIMRNNKFNKAYVELVNSEFNSEEHLFLFLGGYKSEKFEIPLVENVKIGKPDGNSFIKKLDWFFKFQKEIFSSPQKVYLHGLLDPTIILFLFIQPWVLAKCNWVIWGDDLYSYRKPKRTVIAKFKEFTKKFCIKRVTGIITYLKGDYELARKWYSAKGEYLESLVYESNTYSELPVSDSANENGTLHIQVGNSADVSNNHKDVFDKLKKYRDENIKIICPLSYGNDSEYAKKMEQYGYELFGDKFVPLTTFMDFSEYLKILGTIDIAIFNHDREQAMGNIITLLGLGKKVFVRSDIVTWQLFEELDIAIFDPIDSIDIERIAPEIAQQNRSRIKERFSRDNLIAEWGRIFESTVSTSSGSSRK